MKKLAICLPLALAQVALAGCGSMFKTDQQVDIPAVCEDQVYADPAVKDMIMKGAGTDNYRINHENQLRAAKQDAAMRCMVQKGLARPGGGVERPRISG